MSRRYYGFERRKKEESRRAKQEAKRQRKSDRAKEGESGPEMGTEQDSTAPAGVWEWFSTSRNRTATTPSGTRPDTDPPDDWILLTDVGEEREEPEA